MELLQKHVQSLLLKVEAVLLQMKSADDDDATLQILLLLTLRAAC